MLPWQILSAAVFIAYDISYSMLSSLTDFLEWWCGNREDAEKIIAGLVAFMATGAACLLVSWKVSFRVTSISIPVPAVGLI